MNLKPLNKTYTFAASNLPIQCFVTKKVMHWIDAMEKGWKYNAAGIPFSTDNYFSPEGLAILESQKSENKP